MKRKIKEVRGVVSIAYYMFKMLLPKNKRASLDRSLTTILYITLLMFENHSLDAKEDFVESKHYFK